ncbi:unnamed protein product [Ectocarpus sp. CCAP 1310/34]|nr:unnamed protein product [Ectocarpus sp. CCAP 1310/34]
MMAGTAVWRTRGSGASLGRATAWCTQATARTVFQAMRGEAVVGLSAPFGRRESGGDGVAFGGCFALRFVCSALPPAHVVTADFPNPRPGATVFMGDSGAVIHAVSSGEKVYNRGEPGPDERRLMVGDGACMPVSFFGDLDLLLHCDEDVLVTLKNVAVAHGLVLNLISLNRVQERHRIVLDHAGASSMEGKVKFTKYDDGNFVQATRVAHGPRRDSRPLPVLAAAAMRPGPPRSMNINDFRYSLGHASYKNLVETAEQLGVKLTGVQEYCEGDKDKARCPQGRPPFAEVITAHGACFHASGGAVHGVYGWNQLAANGELGCVFTDNGTGWTNDDFRGMLAGLNIARELTAVDGPKSNERVERRIALVMDGAKTGWHEYRKHFPDRVSCACGGLRSHLARGVISPPDSPNQGGQKRERCFYLDSGSDNSSNTVNIILPSGVATYSAQVTFGYRRQAFGGEVPTWGAGAVASTRPWAFAPLSDEHVAPAAAASYSPGGGLPPGASAAAASSSPGGGLPPEAPAAAASSSSGGTLPPGASAATTASSSSGGGLPPGALDGGPFVGGAAVGGRVVQRAPKSGAERRPVPAGVPQARAGSHNHIWAEAERKEFAGLRSVGTFVEHGGAFVQSKLDEDVFVRLPQGCGALSGKVVKLGRSLYGLRQASRTWHKHLMRGMQRLGCESCAADAYVMRLIEDGVVTMVAVIHVDDIFSIGRKSRCDQFGVDLNLAQRSVTLSSTEAEYVSLSDGMKETIFLRYLWSFIFSNRDVGCTLVHEDNVGAIHLASNPATTPNSKHIDIRHQCIRERVARGEFRIVHVRSDLQRADFLTKALSKEAFCAHRDFVMNLR